MEDLSSRNGLNFFNESGKIFTVNTCSQRETSDIAFIFGNLLKANDVICLDGDLGAGKTVFAAGIAKAIGIRGPVPSPTFTVLIEHRNGRIPFYHFDAYRLSGEGEFFDLGFDEYFYDGGICVFEWASNIEGVFDEKILQILIFRDMINSGDIRDIKFCFPEEDERFYVFRKKVDEYYDNFSQ